MSVLEKASSLGAAFNSNEREPAQRCLPQTREAILGQLWDWAYSDYARCLCWLEGIAGSGKSAIAQTIAERCAKIGILAASFFFSQRHSERSNPIRLFPTIALQLAINIPQTRDAIYQAISDNLLLPHQLFRDQFRSLIVNPLLMHTGSLTSPMIIVIDALDECDRDELVQEIISLFIQNSQASQFHLHVLVTSRPQVHIKAKITAPDSLGSVRVFHLHEFRADADICTFLHESFIDIQKRRQYTIMGDARQQPSDDVIDAIVRDASGLFIFVSTVTNFIDTKDYLPERRLLQILDVERQPGLLKHTDLDRLYLDIVSAQSNDSIVMGTVVLLFTPLPVQELARLLNKEAREVYLLLEGLRSVILVPEKETDPVCIYHTSFRDFLVDSERSLQCHVDPSMYHADISKFCLQLLVKELKQDLCDIHDPSKLNSELLDRKRLCDESIPKSVQYACHYWAFHLVESLPNENLLHYLTEFTHKSLLYWIEALSLLHYFEDCAISSLQMVKLWLKVVYSYLSSHQCAESFPL